MRALIESSPVAQRGTVGVVVVDLKSGETILEVNPNRFFVPASNTKLFTTALGLLRLGPDHRFQTVVTAAAPPDANGRITGSLTLLGGGDANLSGRELPYREGAPLGNPLAPIEELAGQIVARGVRRIDGGIVGDDTAWLWDPYPGGWAVDDMVWDYGAPVSALAIGDNIVTLTVRPGDPVTVTLEPQLEYFLIDNRVQTGNAAAIHIDREPGSRQVRLWGTIPAKSAGLSYRLALDDPALYAATALRDALSRRGVAIRGAAVARHSPDGPAPAGLELARLASAPLIEDLRVIGKVSQNLHAEMLLRAVGRARRDAGTGAAGLEELRALLKEAGIEKDEYRLHDGSGLSRGNLVTPAAVVKLLRFLYAGPQRENWVDLLPVGGADGTLRARLKNTPAASRIRAKTGSLGNVTALSGYAESQSGALLAFAILVNNANLPAAETRAFVDKLVVAMVE